MRAFSQLPKQCIEAISSKVHSVRQAIDPKCTIQLSEWNRLAPNPLKIAMVSLIGDALEDAGFKPTDMTNKQVSTLVMDIIEKYPYYRLDDVVMCLKKGRTDEAYPSFYGRIDNKVFMKWFSLYDKERTEAIQSHPSNNQSIADFSQGIPWEQYREDLMAMIAGGDLYANENLRAMESVQRRFAADRGKLFAYRYNQKHKFDDR